MSQNGYAKQLQLWQEGPVGDSMAILCELYTRADDFDQVTYSILHLTCNTDNNAQFYDVFNTEHLPKQVSITNGNRYLKNSRCV